MSPRAKVSARHLSERSFVVDRTGFMTARCQCGFRFGPVPGPEEVLDVLMDHAFEMGRKTALRAQKASSAT